MKGNSQKDPETAMEFGSLITMMKTAIAMRANIKMIEKMALEFIDGKTGLFTKGNFWMTLNMGKE